MTPQPFSYDLNNYSPINPGGATLEASGNREGSYVADWFVHIQTLEIMFVRANRLDALVSSVVHTPETEYNFLDAHFTVKTNDLILKDASFDGSLWLSQTLELESSHASGGFGPSGNIYTLSSGYYRREVEVDTKGNILDTTGVCVREGNISLDKHAGPYDINADTSGNVNNSIHTLVSVLPDVCSSFQPALVNM